MSGISSGIGLISGINSSQLIDQLIEIEARPVRLLQSRVRAIDTQRTALLELSAKLLGAQNAVTRFAQLSVFRNFNGTSTNDHVLTATLNENATAGVHTFRVRSVATQQAFISRGFADADQTPVGAGTLTVERAAARVDRATELDSLNGGQGVRRGTITITDRSGASADIDLTAAVTVEDVLDAINTNTRIHVRARVTGLSENGIGGDRIVIEDLTESTDHNLIVADRAGGVAALDLGITANVAADRVDGKDLMRLSLHTSLASLNDANGIGRAASGTGDDLVFETAYGTFNVSLSDLLRPETDLRALNSGQGVRLGVIRVTDRSGRSAEIDLSQAATVQDVREAIEAADVAISVAIVNSNFQIRDTSETPQAIAKNLKIEDLSGFAAADLGIAGDVAADTITGRSIYRVSTIGDVIRAINLAPGNTSLVEASLSADGKGIRLAALGFENTVTVTGTPGSAALNDLGLSNATFATNSPFESARLVAGLNTVLLRSLKGGAGVTLGTVRFTDGANQSSEIDFSRVQTLQDVLDLINADPAVSLEATVNRAGNGIVIKDQSGVSGGSVLVEDITGNLAADLGIDNTVGEPLAASVDGGNLQLQYVSRQTRLTELAPDVDDFSGEFQITDRLGNIHVVSLASNLSTVGEVIDAINLRTPDTLEARINDAGDGIVIIDHSEGTGTLTIQDRNGGSAAANLRLAGRAQTGENFVDGSTEIRIAVNAGDTLRDLASKLNAAGAGLSATVLNEGRGSNPFSLTITSHQSGRRGSLTIDAGELDLGLDTLIRAQDAVLNVGAGAGANPRIITSSSNSLNDVVEGVSLEIHSTTDEPVTITVAQNVDSIVESVRDFVDRYNEVQADIDDKTSFNQDTLERGTLLGDPTVNLIRSRLHRAVLRPFGEDGDPAFLVSVGLRRTANNRLELDEEKFREAYQTSPEKVERLFTDADKGVAAVLKDSLEGLTKDFGGVIAGRDGALADQQEILNDRIEGLNRLLDAKRARLEAQFVALESALAGLQGQQNALSGLIAQQARRPV